ncbi:hypothetical protein LU631_11325 [Erwinia tracheiphila]|nr:hypothetical protein [Erwinia tracheiphila]UIA86135.1 hypothetical protein LU631_13655 [Erwinia tracheiphila]UIA87179.1 hypothetical protein LU631_20790 [Erwinia tracheiphila]UIA89603.1 hypothetical protein LU631_10810 [Erwinia tracheiphila]UIA89689.1 hypothetical protein LU631_11325 [Erwinia tracheiphila]UIA95539.1 hypothetical protein LU633_19240 [Erwinia tracheiphila]
MKNISEIDTQYARQFPVDTGRALRVCRMTAKQAAKLRDMPTDELANQIFVSAEEFAYVTGRTLKSVQHLMDRNQIPVHREGMPGSKRPKRFIMMQEYLDALRHCRAIITADERYHIDRLMRDKATYRRSSIKSGRTVNGRSPA